MKVILCDYNLANYDLVTAGEPETDLVHGEDSGGCSGVLQQKLCGH